MKLEIVKEAGIQLGSGINGGALEKCVLPSLTFHPLSGLSRCLLRHSYVVRQGGFGDNVFYSSDLIFVECLVLDLLLLLICVLRNNAAMLRRCQLENQ